jgi:hypothetical protein
VTPCLLKIDFYTLFWPTKAEYVFFSISHGAYTIIDTILVHKTHLNKFKRIEITQSMLSDHDGIKVGINN